MFQRRYMQGRKQATHHTICRMAVNAPTTIEEPIGKFISIVIAHDLIRVIKIGPLCAHRIDSFALDRRLTNLVRGSVKV